MTRTVRPATHDDPSLILAVRKVGADLGVTWGRPPLTPADARQAVYAALADYLRAMVGIGELAPEEIYWSALDIASTAAEAATGQGVDADAP